MARIAFFGAGLIGEPMAHRLIGAGHHVVVVAHRNRGPIERLVRAGAVEARTPAAAAKATDVAILMLPTARDVDAVLFDPEGVGEGMDRGYAVVDMGTSFPPDTRRIAARVADRGGRFLDAPVTGGPGGARAGTLTLMVGGDVATLDDVRPVFAAMASHVYHFGDVGTGHTAKLVQNMISIVSAAAIAEGFALAAAAHLDVGKLYEMLSSLPAASPALQSIVPRVFAREFAPVNVRLNIIYKDIRQATALAREMTVPLPTANGATELLQLARAFGFGDLDATAVVRGLETLVGVEVRPGEA